MTRFEHCQTVPVRQFHLRVLRTAATRADRPSPITRKPNRDSLLSSRPSRLQRRSSPNAPPATTGSRGPAHSESGISEVLRHAQGPRSSDALRSRTRCCSRPARSWMAYIRLRVGPPIGGVVESSVSVECQTASRDRGPVGRRLGPARIRRAPGHFPAETARKSVGDSTG